MHTIPNYWNPDVPTSEPMENNRQFTVLASGVRSATTNSEDFTNKNHRGVILVFDITDVPGTDTVTLSVAIKDPVSLKYVTILDGSAEVAVATKIYAVYPGVADTETKFDAFEEMPLPRTWRVTITHSAGSNFTYSVGAMPIL